MNPRYQPPPYPTHKEYIPDIRKLPLHERQSLNTGPTVRIYDGTNYIMDLPRNLVLATTANHLLIDAHSTIRMPPDTGAEAILSLGCHLLALTTAHRPFKMRATRDLGADLRVLKAARLLYLDTYTVHIHSWYWWKLKNRPISAADVQVVLRVALGSDDPFLCLVAGRLARLLRDGVGDCEKLREYVDGQPYLKSVVTREGKQQTAFLENRAKRGARCEARLENEEGHISHVPVEEDEGYVSAAMERRAKVGGRESRKKARNASTWEKKRQEELEVKKSLQEKMQLGKNGAVVTRAEARYYERIKGKRCPYKVKG